MRWPLFRSVRAAPFSGIVWALGLLLYANNAWKTEVDTIVWVATEPVGSACHVVIRPQASSFRVCEVTMTSHGPSSRCVSDNDLSTMLRPGEFESFEWCEGARRLPIRIIGDQCRPYDEIHNVVSAISYGGSHNSWLYHDVQVGPEESRSQPCASSPERGEPIHFWTWMDDLTPPSGP